MNLPKFHRNLFLITVMVYLLTAWNSTGYHSADEHYQIIAFAQWKLGELPAEHLPWEFAAGIRSSLQPWIAVVGFHSADAFGLGDPFSRAFLLRLLTAALALIAVRGFVRVTIAAFDTPRQKAYIIVAYLLWFLPFLHVRFSSEGWSGIFLLFMLTAIQDRGKAWPFQAGVFAGIAMLCRPPTGLIVLSAIAWMLLVRKDQVRHALLLASGLLLVLAVGLIADHAFYGRFTPTTWNYVHMGFAGDPEHPFDELPWYYYPPWIVKYATPPLGAIMLLAFVVLIINRPKHLAVWCVLPYLLAHSFITHKELRFLYPLADLVPWILVTAWIAATDALSEEQFKPLRSMLIGMLGLANIAGLGVVMFSSAGEGRVRLAEELHRRSRPGDRVGYLIPPNIAWRIALPDFYRPEGTEEVVFSSEASDLMIGELDHLVAHRREAEYFAERHGLDIRPLARTEPAWVEELMRWYTWGEGQRPWTLYHVEPRVP